MIMKVTIDGETHTPMNLGICFHNDEQYVMFGISKKDIFLQDSLDGCVQLLRSRVDSVEREVEGLKRDKARKDLTNG